MRAHLFSSVGGLHAMHTLRGDAGTSAEVAANLMRGTRVCVGAGLLVPTPMGRLELSLTKVLKRQGPNSNPNPNHNHNPSPNPSPNPNPNPNPNSNPNPNPNQVLKRQGQDATQRSGLQLGLSGKIV